MKNKVHRHSTLKHQLNQLRMSGSKNPKWNLSQENVELVISWGYPVRPCLYRIKTKAIFNVQNKASVLKAVHYAYIKERKNVIFRPLNSKEKEALDANFVHYVPYKYEIILRGYKEE